MDDDCCHQDDVYLTPVPRGLHHVAIAVIKRELINFSLIISLVGEPVESDDDYAEALVGQLQKPHGSLFDQQTLQKHVSVGHHEEKKIWSTSGVWEGSVWIMLSTNAPVPMVRSIAVLGPLLGLASLWNIRGSSFLTLNSTMQEAIHTIQCLVREKYSFDKAFDLWKRHSRHWPYNYQVPSCIRYRASCIRGHSEEYLYSREALLKEVVDIIVPDANIWNVNLVNYDIEVVLLVISPACISVGLSLQPYQLLKTKGFQGNIMPPDVSPPYISGKLTSGVTRLRPTNTFLLFELANIKMGDVVLDPCCGIGTIPLNIRSGIGIGGDVGLTSDGLLPLAQKYLQAFGRSNPSSNLCAWDASWLPIRSASIDVVVTDLPFGKLCLSSNKLYQLLPLWFSELARVLRPGTGRAVLLCGATTIVIEALRSINMSSNCNWDISSVFPVNIGGLLAWVVVVNRTHAPPTSLMNHRQRLQKLTAARQQTRKRSKSKAVTQR